MLVETQASAALASTEANAALSERFAPRSSPLSFDQIEGVQNHAGIVTAVADAGEARHAVFAAAHRLAVDDAGAQAQARQRLHNQGEAGCEIVAGAAVEADAAT